MGDKVKEEVLAVLNGNPMPETWNDTFIVLNPEVKNLDKVKDLQPISLCNVLYKLVSKVLDNRLKKFFQRSFLLPRVLFIPGCFTDNVLLVYELIHHLRNRRKGKEGLVAIKPDMSKAYDRVEWIFQEKIMTKMGFATRWVDLIMKCVSIVKYRVKVNGDYSEHIRPHRGLRQGDPLPPYLFIICAEGLSALFKRAEKGELEGIQLF
jgi:hypothetical protein